MRPFILILDWMLENATSVMGMNLPPYPNFCKTGIKGLKNSSILLIAAGWFSHFIVSTVLAVVS